MADDVHVRLTSKEAATFATFLRDQVDDFKTELMTDQEMPVPDETDWQREKRVYRNEMRLEQLQAQIETARALIDKIEQRMYLLVQAENATDYLWFGSEIAATIEVENRNGQLIPACIVSCVPAYLESQRLRYRSGMKTLSLQSFDCIENVVAWVKANKEIIL